MSSRKTNEGVMTFFRGDGGEEGKIGLRKDFTKGGFRVNHISTSD